MALTLQRPRAHEGGLPRAVRTAVAVTTGPLGVLVAAAALSAVFLAAVADLVTRLG